MKQSSGQTLRPAGLAMAPPASSAPGRFWASTRRMLKAKLSRTPAGATDNAVHSSGCARALPPAPDAASTPVVPARLGLSSVRESCSRYVLLSVVPRLALPTHQRKLLWSTASTVPSSALLVAAS
jgi:hypothetical protein